MSRSTNPDPNDPYYISSVPMYRDFREELDMNDTIGDRFFEEMAHNLENTPPSGKIMEKSQPCQQQQMPRTSHMSIVKRSVKGENSQVTAAVKEEDIPKVSAKPRPISRRSQFVSVAREPKQPEKAPPVPKQPEKAPPVRPWNLRSSRSEVPIAPPTAGHDTPPKLQHKPAIVQPPMRFGNVPIRRSVMPMGTSADPKVPATPTEENIPKVRAKPRPISRRSVSVAPRGPRVDSSSSEISKKTTETETKQPEKAPPVRPWNLRSSRSGVPVVPPVAGLATPPKVQHKPAIVQPPMRFGNIPARRSVMPVEAPKVHPPKAIGVRGTGQAAAKTSDVSHAVRGISVVRQTPTKNQPKEE